MANKKLEDLNLTSDELSRLNKAFKDEKFCKMFAEYAEEISDPENRRRYEEEIALLERDRGMDVKFIQPEPGYVLKTATIPGNVKAFINICKNEHIEEARCNREVGTNGKSGLSWSIPHSFAPVRDDMDKQGGKCKVFDFVIHPNTYRMSESNARFMKMIEDTALAGVERQFGIKLDKKNYKKPKTTFKGTPTATVIRSRTEGVGTADKPKNDVLDKVKYPYDDKTSEEKAKELADKVAKEKSTEKAPDMPPEVDDEYQKPTFVIKHRSNIDLQQFTDARDAKPSTRPTELCIEIDLPLLKSAASVELDIFEKKLQLSSQKVAKYKLDIDLPYEVDENNGSAKFDKGKRKLVVTLPVVPGKVPESLMNGHNTLDSTSAEDSNPEQCNNITTDVAVDVTEPLIEVLSSEEYHGRESVDTANASTENSSEEMETTEEAVSDLFTEAEAELSATLPSFDYLQDDETVTLILDVKNVKRELVTKDFLTEGTKCIGLDLRLKSIGSGGFPMHFRFVAKFSDVNHFDEDACYIDISEHNLVATLVKDDECLGPWEHFMVGSSCRNLEEKLFLTEHYVKRQLQQLDKEHGESGEQQATPELEVTDMNTSQLILNIKENRGLKHSMSESGEEIEVVHEKECPKLHGILKQQSRTTSESSDDFLSSSYNRHYSTGESSPTPLTEESEEDQAGSGPESGMRKSVSFSEEVDRTLYKTHQSVTSIRSTLKNKRKKAQKKEKKQADREKKRNARRRRNSNSLSEPSSDELTGSGNGGEESENTGERVMEETVQSQNDIVEQESIEDKETGKSIDADQVNLPKVTEPESVATVKGTSESDLGSGALASCDKESAKVVNGSLHNGGLHNNGLHNGGERTCDSDDDETENQSDGVQSVKASNNEEPAQTKADTMLSWEEGKPQGPKQACPVQFSNSVMFELDLD